MSLTPVEIKEYYCRSCGWTEPEFQAGDPAICPGCSTEYEPAYALEVTQQTGHEPPTRLRTWPRCGAWTNDRKRCENQVPIEDQTCRHHD